MSHTTTAVAVRHFQDHELLACASKLKGHALKLARSPDQADDLVQETLTIALTKQHQFQPGTNLNAWLYTIMRNAFFSEARTRTLRAARLLEYGRALLEREAVEWQPEVLMDVAEVWHDLKPEHQAMIVAAYHGMRLDELADSLNVPVGTVKSRLSRARNALAGHLGDAYLTSRVGGERRRTMCAELAA